MSDAVIRHEREEKRWVLYLDGEPVSVAEYSRRGDSYAIEHTVTRPGMEGRGLARQLVQQVLTDVRSEGATVVPVCSYVAAYLRRHPEEQDLLREV